MSQTLEALHTDLRRYVRAGELRHPLVHLPSISDRYVALANRQYQEKIDQLARAIVAQDWHGYIGLHEPAYRVRALNRVARRLSDDQYWRLMRSLWSDRAARTSSYWPRLWGSDRPYREQVMTVREQRALARLPDRVTLYRGIDADDDLAWTLKHKLNGELLTTTVGRDRIRAYFIKGQEAIVLPTDCRLVKTSRGRKQ